VAIDCAIKNQELHADNIIRTVFNEVKDKVEYRVQFSDRVAKTKLN
jgi:hypothetical protein